METDFIVEGALDIRVLKAFQVILIGSKTWAHCLKELIYVEIQTTSKAEWGGIGRALCAGMSCGYRQVSRPMDQHLKSGFSFSLENLEALPPLGLHSSVVAELSRACPFRRYVHFPVCQAYLSHLIYLSSLPRPMGNQVWKLWLSNAYCTLTPGHLAWLATLQQSSL